MKTWIIAGVAALLLVAVIALPILFSKAPPEPGVIDTPAPAPTVPAAMTQATPPAAVQKAVPRASTAAKPATEEVPALTEEGLPTAEAALESMQQSLARGDSRTPDLREDVQRERPTAEILNDPVRYEAYEQAQSRQIAGGYLTGMMSEIPKRRAFIEAAKINGTLDSEEIAEAEEQLVMYEKMIEEMRGKDPALVEEIERKLAPAGETP